MSEPLFKIGSVYRDEGGRLARVDADEADGSVHVLTPSIWSNDWVGDGWRDRASGVDLSNFTIDGQRRNLIPGALHLVNGSWEPVEDKQPELSDAALDAFRRHYGQGLMADPNAAMIARDGPEVSKPAVVALPTPPLTTAHKAVKGLTFLGRVDHRLGMGG